MNEHEIINRHLKAVKIAAALHAHDIGGKRAMMFSHEQWVMASAGAGVIPASEKTQRIVVGILRAFELAKANADKFSISGVWSHGRLPASPATGDDLPRQITAEGYIDA